MSVVIGIDADARRLAYAVMRGGAFHVAKHIERSSASNVRCGDYHRRLIEFMQAARKHNAVIYLEDIYLQFTPKKPGYTQHFSVTGFQALAEVQGEIKLEANSCQVPIVLVKAVTWYSEILGITRDRDKLKPASMKVAQRIARRDLSQHEADAVCLALYGTRREQSWGQVD